MNKMIIISPRKIPVSLQNLYRELKIYIHPGTINSERANV